MLGGGEFVQPLLGAEGLMKLDVVSPGHAALVAFSRSAAQLRLVADED